MRTSSASAAELESYRPRYNIAPTDPHWIMRVKHEDRVILTEEAADAWLLSRQEKEALRPLLVPPPEDVLIATPVSPRANSVKNDEPGVLEEVASPGLI